MVGKRTVLSFVWAALAAGCLVMSGLSLAGVLPRTDPHSRHIFALGWLLIGAGWIGRLYLARKQWRRSDEGRQSDEDRAP